MKGEELFGKELTVEPGTKVTIKDNGAYGMVAVQGSGSINGKPLQTAMIRFGELTGKTNTSSATPPPATAWSTTTPAPRTSSSSATSAQE
ncbi:MAG: hypothetical protein U0744_11960 [Gemmataceae bacterium]